MTYAEKKEKLAYIKVAYSDIQSLSYVVEELEKAWSALEFYADENKYGEIGPGDMREVDEDQGKRAREALGD